MLINQIKLLFGKIVLLFVVLVSLSACQSLPTIESNQDIRDVTQITKWTARGKMMVADGKDKVSGYFYWQQDGQDFDFSLDSIIGTNIFAIRFEQGLATVEADGKTYQDTDPQRLIYRLTGYLMPVNQMPNWLLARIGNQAQKPIYDANNQLSSFSYGNGEGAWLVTYGKWTKQNSLALPQSISLTAVDHRVKISISDWRVEG